jgi:hypothetical protein
MAGRSAGECKSALREHCSVILGHWQRHACEGGVLRIQHRKPGRFDPHVHRAGCMALTA